jgi:osmoprotectant transport system permease protein
VHFHLQFHKLSTWQWELDHLGYFWHTSLVHLALALGAVLIGLAVALPLGVLCARVRGLYGPVLAVSSLLYSLPSLAAFAFLVNVTGLSNTTVLIPLATYALAVLVRSVVDGLDNVAEEVRIAATAMGYGPLRRLVTVELPATVPVVVAGLRVATVSSISLVTVGALIGIGGLGQLFTEGLNTNYPPEILTGILLVAFWALVFDALLLVLRRVLAPWARRGVGT